MDSDNPFRPPESDVERGPAELAEGRGDRISPAIVRELARTRPWVLFIGLLSILFIGLLLLASFALVPAIATGQMGGSGTLMTVSYLVFGLLYAYPTVCLVRYGWSIQEIDEDEPSAAAVETALRHQTSFWRTVGILAIAMVGVYVVMIGIMIAAGVSQGVSTP